MRASKFIHTGALGAVAAALTFAAMPANARPGYDDADGTEHHQHGHQQAQAPAAQPAPQQQAVRQQQVQAQQVQRQQWQAQRQQWQQARPQGQDQQARQQWQQQRSQWQGQRNDWQNRQQQDAQRVQQVERQQQYQRQQQAQVQQQYQVQQRNRTYSDQNRTRDYGAYRGQTYNGSRGTYGNNNAYRYQNQGYRDGNRTQWNRTWRNDNRYDWQRYRASNRNVFHLGRYYSPYRNYSYRRFSIGLTLDPLFYGENYWIADPWQYRLPEVYGPYRWVRYYDDALLVDVYSGEVVDVIYDFFW